MPFIIFFLDLTIHQDTILATIISSLILKTTLGSRKPNYPHFTDKAAEAQTETCPGLQPGNWYNGHQDSDSSGPMPYYTAVQYFLSIHRWL